MRTRCLFIVGLWLFCLAVCQTVCPEGGWGASPEGSVGEPESTIEEKTEQNQGEQPVGNPEETEEVETDPLFEVKARIHVRFELVNEREGLVEGDGAFRNNFLIRRARLKFFWTPTPWVMGVVQVGAEREFELGSAILNDAYIHISPLPYLELRVGQFKKPFSGLELRSSGKLKILERGIGNEHIVEDLRYGDRDLGFQLSGRVVPSVKLDYAVGVFNGSGPNIADQGNSKDVAARLTMRPIKQLKFGLSGSIKWFDKGDAPSQTGWAAAADVRFRYKGLRLFAEGMVAWDHLYWSRINPPDSAPIILGAVGIAAYRHRFPGPFKFRVEPVFKFEVLDPSADIVADEVFIFGPGFNAYFGKYLRFMVHAEFRRSERNSRLEYPDTDVLLVQFCFDI